MGARTFLLTMLDNDAANRKLEMMTADVECYQGIRADDERMVINGVVPEYARPRQQQFWRWRLDAERE